jgi:hypothetical protein
MGQEKPKHTIMPISKISLSSMQKTPLAMISMRIILRGIPAENEHV